MYIIHFEKYVRLSTVDGETIWCRITNKCPGYDTKPICGWGFSLGTLVNVEYPFIAITPSSTQARIGSIYYGAPSMGQIE